MFLKHASPEDRYERIDRDALRIIEEHRNAREKISARTQAQRLMQEEREAA